jgi:hypothetical protein
MRIMSGIKEELPIPNKINPAVSKVLDAFTTTIIFRVVSKAKKAMKRPLKWGGTRRGTTMTAGMPAARGMEAAKPALDADMPLISRIFGSQLEKPCPTAKEKSAINRRILTFRTLMSLRNTSIMPVLSVAAIDLVARAKNHHKNPTAKVSNP